MESFVHSFVKSLYRDGAKLVNVVENGRFYFIYTLDSEDNEVIFIIKKLGRLGTIEIYLDLKLHKVMQYELRESFWVLRDPITGLEEKSIY